MNTSENKKYEKENIYCLGDTHRLNFVDLLRKCDLKNFILLHGGDIGIGFNHHVKEDKYFKTLDEYCEKYNGTIFLQPGNHDRYKSWFELQGKYKNLDFVKKNEYRTINDKLFFFSGGAVSIDRQIRTEGRDYWKDEIFVLPENLEELPKCDVLLTHSSSINNFPFGGVDHLANYFVKDLTLKEELIEERKQIQKLMDHMEPELYITCHFHQYHRLDNHLALGIDQIVDITNSLK